MTRGPVHRPPSPTPYKRQNAVMEKYTLLAGQHDEPILDGNGSQVGVRTFTAGEEVPAPSDLVAKFGPGKFQKVRYAHQPLPPVADGTRLHVGPNDFTTTPAPQVTTAPPAYTGVSPQFAATAPVEVEDEDEEGDEDTGPAKTAAEEAGPEPVDVTDEYPQASTAGVLVLRLADGSFMCVDADDKEKPLNEDKLTSKTKVTKYLKSLLS